MAAPQRRNQPTTGTIGKVVQGIRGSATLIKDMARLREIVGVFVRHGFGEFVERMNLQDNAIVTRFAGATLESQAGKTTPERLAQALEELGPTFIKLGQILSTRPDLVPRDFIVAFEKLQDNVAVEPPDVIRATIEESFGKPISEALLSFDETPLAAASIAQVHRAVLLDGTPVVLKVRRPGAARLIGSDLSIMHFLARRVDATTPEAHLVDLPGIVSEFERSIRQELDFELEAANIERFQRMFDGDDGVLIPRVHAELSSESVLVMQFIDGVKITDAPDHGFDPREIVERCIAILKKMLLDEGFFHGDLHPGNVLITHDGKVALLDFGMVGRMTPMMRDQALDFIVAVARADYASMSDILYEIGIKESHVDYNAFQRDVMDVVDRQLIGSKLGELDFSAIIADIVDGALRHNIRVPRDWTMMFKAFITMEGLARKMAGDMDLITSLRPHVEQAVKERYSPERVTAELLNSGAQLARVTRQMPFLIKQVMREAQAGQLKFPVVLEGWHEIEDRRRQSSWRAPLATLTAGLFIAASLSLNYGTATSLGVPAVSLMLFVFAALLTFGILWDTLWRG